MKTFVRRLIAATLPVLSAATLFAGSAHADLTLPPPPGDDRIQVCLRNGGTPEQCAGLLNPTHVPAGGLKPATTQIRRITNVRANASAISTTPFQGATPLIRSR